MEADASLWVAEDMVPHSQETRRNVSRSSVDQGSGGRGDTERRGTSPVPALSWEAGGAIPAGASCDSLKKWRWQDVIRSGLNLGTEDPFESYQFSHF